MQHSLFSNLSYHALQARSDHFPESEHFCTEKGLINCNPPVSDYFIKDFNHEIRANFDPVGEADCNGLCQGVNLE